MSDSSLIISLDFELHWGRFDKYPIEEYQLYYQNTIRSIPKILSLFERYQINATWATVGMLMAESWEEWETYAPQIKPNFLQEKYSAYLWGKQKFSIDFEGLFASGIVNEIIQCPGQELASHTFSHYYTGEEGGSLEAFRSDLMASKKIAKDKFGVDLESLVFPRNQYNDGVLEIAAACDFKTARINPSDWFWKETNHENLLKKIFRTGDTLIPMGKPVYFDLDKCIQSPLIQIPASRLLRPYKTGSIFNRRRIERIKSELKRACDLHQSYHLWWHPHNFGFCPEENIRVLEELLQYVAGLIQQGDLRSLSMRGVYEKMNSDIELGR